MDCFVAARRAMTVRGFVLQLQFFGQAIALGELVELAPGRVLDRDAVGAALALALMLDLAGIVDLRKALGRLGRLQGVRQLADLTLELSERAEGVDLEHRPEAAAVMA